MKFLKLPLSITPLKEKFKGDWTKLIEQQFVLGIGLPTDQNLDSFALFQDSETKIYWKVLIQSKLRNRGNHHFTDEDLTKQLDYLERNDMITHKDWIMIIRIDCSFKAEIPDIYKDQIVIIDNELSEKFYGPILNHTREIARLIALGEAWDETYNDSTQEDFVEKIEKKIKQNSRKRKTSTKNRSKGKKKSK